MGTFKDTVAGLPIPYPLVGDTPESVSLSMDEASFRAFHQRTVGPLHAYVSRVLGNSTEADDIVQDAYLRLLRAPSKSDDPVRTRAILFRIASNLIVDHWRRRKRESGAAHAGGPEPSASDPDVPLRLDLARTFEKLRPRERAMMWLAYVEGADHREIAAALGLRERSVRVLLHRTRRKLALLLQRSGRSR